ncbi:hypothetical protein OGAPHI_003329 [Ogataea philodendri]|uniref:TRP C-terminal domain-containing protein n=1 Tax=Ogataea philodendri TaxID=1378263 RepID=A0A9P8P8C1_9ASCO|nr:uncharacterized protein OGAPHI_003329 [Ogataea philodendri]KAH3666880.1 hypothetical protein OGAPHI_003329 [Ogataea philodendri]
MFLLAFLALLTFVSAAQGALLNVRSCNDGHKKDNYVLSAPLLNVSYYEQDRLINVDMELISFDTIIDVNDTTNTYTTMHVQLEYVGETVYDEYLRFCDNVDIIGHGDDPNYSSTSSASATQTMPSDNALETLGVIRNANVNDQTVVGSGLPDLPSTRGNGSSHSDRSCPVYAGDELIIQIPITVTPRSAFGTYKIKITFIAPDDNHTIIGCSTAWFSTVQKESLSLFSMCLVIIVCITVFISNMAGYVFSPYIDTNIVFLYRAASICNAPLLNQVCPVFKDYLKHLQFIYFVAGLNLQFPGFYHTLISNQRWIGILGFIKFCPPSHADNVYKTMWIGGLKSLITGSTEERSVSDFWSGFLIEFAIFVAAGWFVQLAGACLVMLFRKKARELTFSRFSKLMALTWVGLVVDSFLGYLAIPFLVYSFFVLVSPRIALYGRPNGEEKSTWTTATVCTFLVLFFTLEIYFAVRFCIMKRARAKLYKSINVMLVWQTFYSFLKTSKIWFVPFEFFQDFVFSFAIGCLQFSGVAQLCVLITSEFVHLCILLVLKPFYYNTGTNVTKISLAVVRVIVSILNAPIAESVNCPELVKTRLIWTILILHLLTIVFVFLVPSLYKLFTTFKLYYKYRKGKKGTDIPDYVQRGEMIEVPLRADNRSFVSLDESFADWNLGPPSLLVQDNETRSLHSDKLEFTDRRVLPGLSMPEPVYNPQTKDLSVREADIYFEAFQGTESDAELIRMWQERGRKLNRAASMEFEKPSSSVGFQVMRPRPRNKSRLSQPTNSPNPNRNSALHVVNTDSESD